MPESSSAGAAHAAVRPALTATSSSDDVVAWVATLDGGKDELRSFFAQIRKLKFGGATILRANPSQTLRDLGVPRDSTQAVYLRDEINKLRDDYIRWAVDQELGRTNNDGKSPLRSRSIWGRARRKDSDGGSDTSRSATVSQATSKHASERPARPPWHKGPGAAATVATPGSVMATRLGSHIAAQTPTMGPPETRDWIILREGFLNKTKWTTSKILSVKSTKLRYFVLRQHPDTMLAHLEYYLGLKLKGSLKLVDTEITLEAPGRFVVVCSNGRRVYLAAENHNVDTAVAWVLALEHASLGADGSTGACRKSVSGASALAALRRRQDKASLETTTSPSTPTTESASAASEDGAPVAGDEQNDSYWKERIGRAEQEVDGVEIDNARWAALRRGWMRDQGLDPDVEASSSDARALDDDDEDVRAMREMEEEEERRQEEERLALLAQRDQANQGQQDHEGEGGHVDSGVRTHVDAVDTDNLSEDEDDWFAQMQESEEAEALRQEQERQEWLKTQL
eukprot:m.16208 g.16208  ORF g.16208 m.16208 type:complete len:512 (-) comp3365_c0_seq2:6-1541(-)